MLIFLSMIENETEKAEFARIYQRYADGVFRKTLYILKNQQDTEDTEYFSADDNGDEYEKT